MSRRYPDLVRETNGRPTVRAYCAWLDDDGTLCDTFGPVVKGLCRRHYDQLRHRVDARRYRAHRVNDLPTTCTCNQPQPVPVRIIGGAVLIPDAYECATCGRAVIER